MSSRTEELTAFVQEQTQRRYEAELARIRRVRSQQGLSPTSDDEMVAAEFACMNRRARRLWLRRFRRRS